MTDWLPHDLLLKLDRCLMAHAVEGRTPFLDPGVMAAAFRLPDAMKLRRGIGQMDPAQMAGEEPAGGAAVRAETGFTVPVGEWIKAQGDAARVRWWRRSRG